MIFSFDSKKESFERFLWILLGLLVVFSFASAISYFYVIRGKERVVVPGVTGKPLTEGILDLQKRGLRPFLELRFTSIPQEKGKIIQQKPAKGSFVKKGRRVSVVVSKGTVLDHVSSYVGLTVEEVVRQIRELFSGHKTLLKIKKPLVYAYNEAPAGVIIAQQPKAGTPISGETELALVVSRGPERSGEEKLSLQDYVGLSYSEALERLERTNHSFVFSFERNDKKGVKAGTVVRQDPPSGKKLSREGTLSLVITPPSAGDSKNVVGLFEHILPVYPIYADMRIEKILPNDPHVRRTILAIRYRGGAIAIPYVEPVGTKLILSVYGKDLFIHVVRREEEKPSST